MANEKDGSILDKAKSLLDKPDTGVDLTLRTQALNQKQQVLIKNDLQLQKNKDAAAKAEANAAWEAHGIENKNAMNEALRGYTDATSAFALMMKSLGLFNKALCKELNNWPVEPALKIIYDKTIKGAVDKVAVMTGLKDDIKPDALVFSAKVDGNGILTTTAAIGDTPLSEDHKKIFQDVVDKWLELKGVKNTEMTDNNQKVVKVYYEDNPQDPQEPIILTPKRFSELNKDDDHGLKAALENRFQFEMKPELEAPEEPEASTAPTPLSTSPRMMP